MPYLAGGSFMLVGEPGIGKTRTVQELAARAEQRGAQVLWGWCYEEEGAPPYWPWLQPIRVGSDGIGNFRGTLAKGAPLAGVQVNVPHGTAYGLEDPMKAGENRR